MPEIGRLSARIAVENRDGLAELARFSRAWDSLGGKLATGFAMGAGIAAFNAGLAAIGKGFEFAGDAAIKFNATLETTQIAFEGLLGSAQLASALMRDLAAFALKTPFSFEELLKGAQRLKALGFEAQQVIPILTDVGRLVGSVGGGSAEINRVTLALGQMTAAGRVRTQEMNQLTEALIPAWEMLAQSTGRTRGELMKMTEQGLIPASTFLKAFHERAETLGNVLERLSKTFTGALSNIRESLQMAGASAFQPLFNLIRDLAVAFAAFLQTDRFARWTAALQVGVRNAVSLLQELMATVRPAADMVGQLFDRLADFAGLPRTFTSPLTRDQGKKDGADYWSGFSEAANDQGKVALAGLERGLAGLNLETAKLRFGQNDITAAYQAGIAPLEKQLQLLQQQTTVEDQLRDFYLDQEAAAIRFEQQRERLVDQATAAYTSAGLRLGQDVTKDLRLLEIENEQTTRRLGARWQEIQRDIAAAPIKAQLDALKRGMEEMLAPGIAQLAQLERAAAWLSIQRMELDLAKKAAEGVAAAWEKVTGSKGTPVKGPDAIGVPPMSGGPPITSMADRLKEKLGELFNPKTWFKPELWFDEGGKALDQFIRGLEGGGLKRWEDFRESFIKAEDAKVDELKEVGGRIAYKIGQGMVEISPRIAKAWLFALKESAILTATVGRWGNELGEVLVREAWRGWAEAYPTFVGKVLASFKHLFDTLFFAVHNLSRDFFAKLFPTPGAQPGASESPINWERAALPPNLIAWPERPTPAAAPDRPPINVTIHATGDVSEDQIRRIKEEAMAGVYQGLSRALNGGY